MKLWKVASLIILLCLAVYWPHQKAEFVLDDYYAVVRNPLIKNPALYQKIWTSRLFDAHPSSGYIKFGYYRPVLESSWILDYRLFGLKAFGYQWLNLLIHALNCFFIYILLLQLFGSTSLALRSCLLFCVLPTQEWVVRYVTGRGDELSALFALVSLVSLTGVFRSGKKNGYILVFLFWLLAALTREVAISYILYALLIYYSFEHSKEGQAGRINNFCLCWMIIGLVPFLVIWSIIPKQGNILVFHVLYFASMGFCLWLAQWRTKWTVIIFTVFAAVSFYQGRFWTTEENLLRHTRSLELWPRTGVAQQLLMKYDDNIPGIKDMIDHSQEPLIKAMWMRRLGLVYFQHKDLMNSYDSLNQALSLNPLDVAILNALAVVSHYRGQEDESLKLLNRALEINPSYPDTLRTLGIYYYVHKNYARSKIFLDKCLFFEPDNAQARELLALVNKAI